MRQRGFTLIELMVTIAVIALILLTAMPSVASWLDNTRIRNVADSLHSGLQIARAEAVRRNQSVSFWLVGLNNPEALANDCTLSSNSGAWVVSVNSPAGHCADAPSVKLSPMLVTGRALGDGTASVSVAAVQADGASSAEAVTFDGFGRVTNTDAIGRIDVTGTSSNVNLRLTVSSVGMVRVCRPRPDPDVTDKNDPRYC